MASGKKIWDLKKKYVLLLKNNKLMILTPLAIGGIIITKRQANIHIFPPLKSADILPYLLE